MSSAVGGISDRALVAMLAQAILEDWPRDARLDDVLASAGIRVRTDIMVRELTA